MLHEAKIRVAFATSSGERIDIGLEDKGKILIYEVSQRSAKKLTSYSFRKSTRAGMRGRPRKYTDQDASAARNPTCVPAYDEETMQKKYALLKNVSALVVSKDLSSESAHAVMKEKVYPIKVENQEFIGVVILRLQELLKENRLLWLRRAIDRTICADYDLEATS